MAVGDGGGTVAGEVVAPPAAPVRLGAGSVQRPVRTGYLAQGQVEEADPDAGLPHVHADEAAAAGRDAQERTGAAAVRTDGTGLLDEAVREERADHVGDRAGAEAGGRAQLLPAQRALEVQPAQHGGPAASAQVADRALIAFTHRDFLPGLNISLRGVLTRPSLTT